MSDRVDRLLRGELIEDEEGFPTTAPLKIAKESRIDRLLSGSIIRKAPTEEPRQIGLQGFREQKSPASLWTQVKAGTVDDPQVKIDVFAKARGIPPERYGIKDGQVFYLGKDGNFYFEASQQQTKIAPGVEWPLGKLKQTGAQLVSHLPEIALSTAGVPSGPKGVVTGAIAGRLIRKAAGTLLGEPIPTLRGAAKEVIGAGGTAYLGEKVGVSLIRGIDITKGRKGARLLKVAGRDRPRIDPKAVKEIEALGKKYGIELWSPQTTGSPELIGRFNLLADLPVTADKIGVSKLKQYAEINTAINEWLGTFGPTTVTKESAGKGAVEAAKKGIRVAKDVRRRAAAKQYQEAMKVTGLDISDTVGQIDEMLKTAARGSSEQKSLRRIKTMLTREGKVKAKELSVAELKKGAIEETPLSDITGLEPKPRPLPTKKVVVTEPVELVFTDQGDLILEAGNHRYHQAVFNGDKTIPAKIRFEKGSEGLWSERIKPTQATFEDRLAVLDKVKKEINSMWRKDPKTAPQITEQRSINKILDSMLSKIDEQVPIYKEARKIFQEGSPAIEKLTKGKVGEIAKLEGEAVAKTAKMVFSPGQSSPEIIARIKPIIVKQGGQKAWGALLRTHIKEKFRDVVKTGTKNIGGQLRKRLFGDLDQREILKKAMTKQQYQNFDDLMKVFERAALTTGKESTTATRQVGLGQLEKEATGLTGKLIRAATRPLYTYQRIGGDFITSLRSEAYQEKLADLMLSPQASKQLQGMLQLRPGSQILLKRLSVFLTTGGGTLTRQRRIRARYQNIRPAILTKPQLIPRESQ